MIEEVVTRWIEGERLMDLLDEQERDASWPVSQTAEALAGKLRELAKADAVNDRLAARVVELEGALALERQGVRVAADELARFRRIEGAATHYARLREASQRAQAISASDSNASPSAGAPTRAAILEAERAVVRAVRS